MRNIKSQITNLMNLPKEIALDLPLVMATGRGEITIENYKNLIEFTETKIRILTKEGILEVLGERLRLKQITTENIVVAGRVSNITYS